MSTFSAMKSCTLMKIYSLLELTSIFFQKNGQLLATEKLFSRDLTANHFKKKHQIILAKILTEMVHMDLKDCRAGLDKLVEAFMAS